MPNDDNQNVELNLLTNYLTSRDVPCPTCGYNLRDLQTNHCPECGHSLEVTIRESDGSMTRWIWAFASSCLSVPFAIYFGIIVVVIILQQSAIVMDSVTLIFTGTYALGMLVAVVLLIRRKQFLRSSVHTQRWITRIIVFYQFSLIGSSLAVMITSIL